MLFLIKLAVFVLGTVVGSFLNVVILRYGLDSISSGRSKCPHCKKELRFFELIPVFSYVFLGGKCLRCKKGLSLQYPLVEILTGTLFLGVFWETTALFDLLFYSVIFSLLVVIFVYDLKHKIIPNLLVYTFIILSFSNLFVDLSQGVQLSIADLYAFLAGPIFFLPFFLMWFLSEGKWMGFGDAKLALGIGWLLGMEAGLSAIILAFWIGAVVGVLLVSISKINKNKEALTSALFSSVKKLTMKSELAFGPFLIIGLWLVFFFELNVFEIMDELMMLLI